MQSIPYMEEERRMLRDAKSVLPSSNWSDLPPDLLCLIYRKLYDTFDFINFRAVCKGWLAAAPLSEHPPQLPFLIERETLCSSELKLYSLHTGKTHRIQVPEAHNKLFYGQSQGYLVTFKIGDTFVTLLNPFTRAEVHLPFHGFNYYRCLHIVGDDAIKNSDLVVLHMTMGNGRRFVGIWKNKDNKWILKGSFPYGIEAYHRGRIFFSDEYYFRNYVTTIVDFTTGNKIQVKLPYNNVKRHDFSFLGEGAGAFLGIQRHFHSSTKGRYFTVKECWFEVYQLDEEKNPPCWVKLNDIGDLIIFLNSDNTGFCLSASDFDGISGNCIYFTSWLSERGDEGRSVIGLYELGKHGSKMIGQLDSEGTWIVPNVF